MINYETKNFYRKTFRTVFPLMVQSLLSSSVNFIDQVMVGKLGINEIAAVGAANKIYSLFYLVLYGTCSALVMFVSQSWGQKDTDAIRKEMGMALTVTLIWGLLVMTATSVFPYQCMRMFTAEDAVIINGVRYLKWVSLSYLLLSLIYPLNYLLRGTQRVTVVMFSTASSVAANLLANYVFIFGKCGMPKMGVAGAALGTVVTRATELLIIIIYLEASENEILKKMSFLLKYTFRDMRLFLSKALPLAGNEFLWGVGTTLYFVIYGRMGTEVLAAMSIMSTLQTLEQTFVLSFSGASAVIIGSEIGAGDRKKVYQDCSRFHKLAVIVGLVASITLLLLMKPILTVYGVEDTLTGKYLAQCMLVLCTFLIINTYNAMNVEGIFRSGGDVKFVLLMDMGGIWLIGLPLTYLLSQVFHQGIVVVYAAFIITELYKLPLGIWRYRSGKWLKELLISQ